MRIAPDEIDVELPRTAVGGLKIGPVEDLLRRVAGDYALLFKENKRLKETLAELERDGGRARTNDDDGAAATVAAPVHEPDELARLVLGAAKQAAGELRSSARRDAEAMLRKANHRAGQLERERAARERELAELETLRRETCERMRAALESALALPGADEPEL